MMMNGNEDDVNLRLSLGYSTSCNQTRVNNNSGAGVNAGPSVDMTFAASDPLSELVWSPQKGLSLKCADCTKVDKKPFLLWNVGPSNMVSSPPKSRFQQADEEKIVDGNLIRARETFDVDGKASQRVSGDKSEERNTQEDKGKTVDDVHKECNQKAVQLAGKTDGSQKNIGQSIQNPYVIGNDNSSPDKEISESQHGILKKESSTNLDNTINKVVGDCQILAGSEAQAEMKKDEITNEAILATEEDNKLMIDMYLSKLPPGVIECTAENDLYGMNTEESYWQCGERFPGGTSVRPETFPINGDRRRGKSKALSDGNFSKRLSNGEDDSYESVESCNSAGLHTKDKRRLQHDKDSVIESKRLKWIDGSSASVSTVKNDSSFMNWISNMVKGFAKSDEGGPSLAQGSNPEHASFLQDTVLISEKHDSMSRNLGFQTIFQSLYSQNTKLIETRVVKDDYSLEESRGILPRLNGLSNENIMSKGINIPAHVDSMAELAENNKASVSLQHRVSESLGMHMITGVKNDNPDSISEGGLVNDMSNKSNLFNSLWITRLSPKTGSHTLNLDKRKQVSNFCETWEYLDHKADSSEIQKRDLAMKHKCSEPRDSSNETSGDILVKELQMFASNTECSTGFKEIHDQNTLLKLNPLLSSHTSKSADAIASVFARRLDALKHIIPSASKNNDPIFTVVTCFFCGKSGHSLGDCSKVTKSELDHLLRNISSYIGAECPCLCIRCFQFGHWAAACPRGGSSSEHVDKNTFVTVGNLKLLSRSSQFQEKKELAIGTVFSGEKKYAYMDIRNPLITGDSLVHRRSSSSNETQKQHTSNSWENNSSGGDLHNLQLSNHVSRHFINIPQGVVDAARRLQVYRADMLKLIKSRTVMPCMEGFFLRVRLGKWEAGLGGTGYHVGCITYGGKAVLDLKKSVCVNVGGVKCQVNTQYVSNQDFLEDEFVSWWSRTQRSGEKLPMKEELESKFKQRINLGF